MPTDAIVVTDGQLTLPAPPAGERARVLLVNVNREHAFFTVVPAGLCAIANATDAAGFEVQVVDLRFKRWPFAALRRAIRRFKPDVIALSIRNIDTASRWDPIFYLAEVQAKVVPACRAASRAPIVVGGAALSVGGQKLVDYVGADWGIVGEAEEAFPQLLTHLRSGTDPIGVPGVVRAGGTPDVLWKPARVDALDTLGNIDPWRWVDMKAYGRLGAGYPLLTRRGCSFGCEYCVYPTIEGERSRLRSPESVAAEVRHAVAHGVSRFVVVDSIFGVPPKHAIGVCDAIADTGCDIQFEVPGLHPLGATTPMLDALKRAGTRGVLCSADSFSAAGLAGLRKGITMDIVDRARTALGASGLSVGWFLILGAPGETIESVRESLRYVEEHLPPDNLVMIAPGLRVYPGTPLADQCIRRGLLSPSDDLLHPTWFVEPAVGEEALQAAIADTATRCPNVTIIGESPRTGFAGWVTNMAIRWGAKRGPTWTVVPRLLEMANRRRDRHAQIVAGQPAQPAAGALPEVVE